MTRYLLDSNHNSGQISNPYLMNDFMGNALYTKWALEGYKIQAWPIPAPIFFSPNSPYLAFSAIHKKPTATYQLIKTIN